MYQLKDNRLEKNELEMLLLMLCISFWILIRLGFASSWLSAHVLAIASTMRKHSVMSLC